MEQFREDFRAYREHYKAPGMAALLELPDRCVFIGDRERWVEWASMGMSDACLGIRRHRPLKKMGVGFPTAVWGYRGMRRYAALQLIQHYIEPEKLEALIDGARVRTERLLEKGARSRLGVLKGRGYRKAQRMAGILAILLKIKANNGVFFEGDFDMINPRTGPLGKVLHGLETVWYRLPWLWGWPTHLTNPYHVAKLLRKDGLQVADVRLRQHLAGRANPPGPLLTG